MNDTKSESKKRSTAEDTTSEPVHTVREGAVAASIWLRQSPAGYPYYDFSLSRSWKSMSSGKTGYSKNFFSRNRAELVSVIDKATEWILREEANLEGNGVSETKAA